VMEQLEQLVQMEHILEFLEAHQQELVVKV
jgi:hypothetical protein